MAVIESPDSLLLRPDQAAKQLSISRAALYNLLRDGSIPSVRIGSSRRIRKTDLAAFVAGQVEQGWAEGGGELASG